MNHSHHDDEPHWHEDQPKGDWVADAKIFAGWVAWAIIWACIVVLIFVAVAAVVTGATL